MTIENIGLFKGIAAKMSYLNQRQTLISQNVANADTPGYIPKDLVKVDFSRVMARSIEGGVRSVSQSTTHSGHMNKSGDVREPRDDEQRTAYEIAPAGNAVILEEQMLQASKNTMDYNLMTTLYQKNVGMIHTVLGRGQ